MKKIILMLLIPFIGYTQKSDIWRLEVNDLDGTKIPVHLELVKDSGEWKAFSLNADQRLEYDHVTDRGDTLYLNMELYDLQMVLMPSDGKTLTGYMSKKRSDGQYIQATFTGTKNDPIRFKGEKASGKLAGKYKMTLINTTSGKDIPAVGLFTSNKDGVKGTFLTSSGDYQYLQGNIIGDEMLLSALGSNVYLYKAKIKGDSIVNGSINTPYSQPYTFSGVADKDFELPDATTLTYLKDGYDKFDFTFKNIFGEPVTLSDFRGAVTVVQILGTWCPNCLEETKFLMDYRKKNPALQVVGLSFEATSDFDKSLPKIMRFIQRFGVDYPILFAGSTGEAAEKLPQLNHVIAYPTSIIIDKEGDVRRIHTGFSGPSSGKYYEDYVKDFNEFVGKLMME